MAKIRLYQSVRLTTDKYTNENLKKGMLGTVLEIYDNANYEIEWYDEFGDVVLMCAFNIADFEAVK